MRKFLMMALLAAGFAACSDEEKTLGGKDIQFAAGTLNKIEVYADETAGTAEGGISFTTTGAWRATVTPVTKAEDAAGTTDWVQVVPDHGDAAGDYTIQVVLGVNATGEDRSATITITCGTTTITITVTQKGTTEDGKVPEEGNDPVVPDEPAPKPYLITGLKAYYEQSPDEGSVATLAYDEEGRLVEWNERSTEGGSVYEDRMTFEYGDREVEVVFHNDEGYTMKAFLDEAGCAYRVEEWGGKYLTGLYYDSEGHIVRMDDKTSGDWEEYVWENGNMTEYSYENEYGEREVWTYTYYEDLENRGNFDLLFDSRPGWCGELVVAGLIGVQSKNLVKTVRGSSEWADKEEYDFSYETDSEGRVVKMIRTDAGVAHNENPFVMEISYDE